MIEKLKSKNYLDFLVKKNLKLLRAAKQRI